MDRERRVGKRLADRLRWLRETPGAETLTPEAWDAAAREAAAEGLPPPDRDEWVAHCIDEGWEPFDDLHLDLLRYERMRGRLGDLSVEGASGPVLDWPAEWGAWSLAEHRATIADHWDELEDIREAERRHR